MPDREPLGVIGAGWVGLVTAACFAELGHEVYCRDIVQQKVDSLARGEVPIYEPGLSELVLGNRERLHFTTDMGEVLSHAQLLFCCVDTPPTYSGDADLSRVETVVREIGDSSDHALVMKSTVPVGTGRAIRRNSNSLGYVSNPEFLKEGTAVSDFMEPDRVVVGTDDRDGDGRSEGFGDRVAALYEPLDAPVVRTDVASAEMIKLASNAFLATKISFINEIANVSEELGADVAEVARGMGLDERIGPQFLQAGIGYGGSCLAGDETVLVRRQGRIWLWTLRELFERVAEELDADPTGSRVLRPDELEVLAWRPGSDQAEFLRASAITRRRYERPLLQVRTKMGRRVRCTPDHPFVVADENGRNLSVKLAADLTTSDWLPLAQGGVGERDAPAQKFHPLLGHVASGIPASEIMIRATAPELATIRGRTSDDLAWSFAGRRDPRRRARAVLQQGALRLDEFSRLGLSSKGATASTARSATQIPHELLANEQFWRVAGLYVAEGHCTRMKGQPDRNLYWTFHPTKEDELVDEVRRFWTDRGVKATLVRSATAQSVVVSSRLLAAWWLNVLGMGRDCYEQRIPDAAWLASDRAKRALLAGMWLGDGSWSYVAHGPSVVLEYGTVSRELADGMLRLLGDLGLIASLRVGRTAKSTRDTYWLRIAGANQVERALDFVPPQDRTPIRRSLARQAKRIFPTGYRRHSSRGLAWVRVVGIEAAAPSGSVYSVEVPDAESFVTTASVICHNCFPKDVSALKQLAGNSGYHFQLLTAVIEVNELQKRRTIGKLQKHLGSLVGKTIALLGLAFKPNTDDMREATSLVLAGRLQSEGATVRVYDPVAAERARELVAGAEVCATALGALDGADGAVLVTEWPEFRELDWAGEVKQRMAQPLVVDGRNFLDAKLMKDAGFTYEGIGRS